MSYTTFAHGPLTIAPKQPPPIARFTVTNTGKRDGAEVGQVYLIGTPGGATTRLIAFSKVPLKSSERRTIEIAIKVYILGNSINGKWHIAAGTYRFALSQSAGQLGTATEIVMPNRSC